jgi:hypothetical protein
MIVLGFVVVGIVAVLVGTFVMVKGVKDTPAPTITTVPVVETTPDTSLDNTTSSGTPALGT